MSLPKKQIDKDLMWGHALLVINLDLCLGGKQRNE